MPAPVAPQDLSGGFLVFEYTKGNLRHRARIHIQPFSADTLDYTAPRGIETNVADTALAWATQFMAFYDSGWSMIVQSLWQMQAGEEVLLSTVPSVSVAGAITGGGIIAPLLLSGENVWNWRTPLGHRGRVVQIAPNGWAPGPPRAVNTGSSGAVGALMTYISGADTMLVTHDGQLFEAHARLTAPYNRRLRRRYAED